MNKMTIIELIDFILESISINNKRFVGIKNSNDFLSNDENLTRMEAILMRLQASGEAIKNLQKRDSNLLESVAPKQYWDEIIRFRDLLSHHYVDIQSDIVFDICKHELGELKEKMQTIKELL